MSTRADYADICRGYHEATHAHTGASYERLSTWATIYRMAGASCLAEGDAVAYREYEGKVSACFDLMRGKTPLV